MHTPPPMEPGTVRLDMSVYAEGVVNGPPSWVPMLSTGLRDAYGVEVFEGDWIEFPLARHAVSRDPETGGFALTQRGERGEVVTRALVSLGHVVGNVVEGIREAA